MIVFWEPKFSVNNKQIDAEHQKLFELINLLGSHMMTGQGYVVIKDVLRDLLRYTEKHFANEEKLFKATPYPHAAMHCLEHQKLTQQVRELQKKLEKNTSGLSVEVLEFLKNWIENHILSVDYGYREWLGK